MELLELMRSSRDQLKPYWLMASLVCIIYGVLVGLPSELNTYGELLSFLLAGPLQLGMCIYFLNIVKQQTPSVENLIDGFKPLANVLLAYLIITIGTLLGLILLIIPGIIISLGLSMTFYILAEYPEYSVEEALKKSWELTDGYKGELFILHLRFIPWYLLGLLFFVVGVFIVMPWHQLTIANYYNYLKQQQA
ncbi:MAG: DUF975 family protein [Flavobacteriia bacterium]|nr:DUF975 family protein [Flavobacteriia bacterium]